MTEKVLISGASGFIASHTIEILLDQGYEIVGTVRDPNNPEKTKHLTSLPGAAERLTLVAADLNDEAPFDNYTHDVDYVLHMASPYIVNVEDPQRDLVTPAINGTETMLKACAKNPKIKRVVVTSSLAAITDEPNSDHVFSESDWNEKSSLTRNPYFYSKTLAEKAAWNFVNDQKPAFDLVTINPVMVIGPAKTSDMNESNKVLADMLNGGYPAIIDLTWGIVDVRDVAKAHVLAITSPNAKGRYLCSADTLAMRNAAKILRENGYANKKLPKMGLDNGFGTALMKLGSYTQPKGVASYLRSHIGRALRLDNSKIQSELGLEFRPVKQSVLDAAADMQQWGHLK